LAYEALAAAFQVGDVLYGLDQPRNAARQAIIAAGIAPNALVAKMYFGCIPGRAVPKSNALIQNDVTNAVWNPLTGGNSYSSDAEIQRALADGGRGVDFRQFLETHPKYDVASQFDATQQGKAAPGGPVAMWGKTSKAGLEFQSRRQGTVQFVMDTLIDNLDMIAGKVEPYGTKGNITSQELRWLYRHRNVTDVRNAVRFWLADGELPRDDLWNNPAWGAYDPKHGYDEDWTQLELASELSINRE
jgi:insecticidal toxin complex protein TccC